MKLTIHQKPAQPFVSHLDRAIDTFEARVESLKASLEALAAEAQALANMREMRLVKGQRPEQVVRVIQTQTRSALMLLNGRQ